METEPRTILVADDDELLRQLMGEFLEQRGWLTLVAEDGEDALRIVDRYPDEIDLLISDIVMPKIDGFTLAAQVIDRRPGIKILYVSGFFNDNVHVRYGLQEAGRFFLRKPFTRDDFLTMVSTALTEPVDATDAFAAILGHPLITAQAMKAWEPPDATPRDLRYQLRLPLRFRIGEVTTWNEGTTQDVSRSGILFETQASLPQVSETGAPITLRLALPTSGVRSAEVLCLGDVVRISPGVDGQPAIVAVAVKSYHADIRR